VPVLLLERGGDAPESAALACVDRCHAAGLGLEAVDSVEVVVQARTAHRQVPVGRVEGEAAADQRRQHREDTLDHGSAGQVDGIDGGGDAFGPVMQPVGAPLRDWSVTITVIAAVIAASTISSTAQPIAEIRTATELRSRLAAASSDAACSAGVAWV